MSDGRALSISNEKRNPSKVAETFMFVTKNVQLKNEIKEYFDTPNYILRRYLNTTLNRRKCGFFH